MLLSNHGSEYFANKTGQQQHATASEFQLPVCHTQAAFNNCHKQSWSKAGQEANILPYAMV
jgi:hypothetical protein